MRPSPIRNLFLVIPLAVFAVACSKPTPPAAATAPAAGPQSEEDKTLYALGVVLSRNLQSFDFTEKEIEQVTLGLKEGTLQKKPVEDVEAYVPKLQALQQERQKAAAGKEKEAGAAFLAKAASEKGANKTASGLVITTEKEGTGASPKASDQVKVHYEGKFTDGKVFDSSIARNEPATFPLTGVIPCWTEALQLMKVGGKAKVVCPSELAYGDEGRPPQMRGGATLVFNVELLEIVKEDPAAAAKAPK